MSFLFKQYRVSIKSRTQTCHLFTDGAIFFFQSSEVVGPVVYLCSLLPHASVSTVAGFCLARLREIPEDSEDLSLALGSSGGATYANALCNWGRGDDMLELLTKWLRKGKNVPGPPQKVKLVSILCYQVNYAHFSQILKLITN